MRKKMIYTMMITGVLAINLTGCGSKTEKQEVTATETEITQESDNVQNESEGAVEATLADGNLQVAQTSLGDQVLIETASLDEQADAFANWKKGI